MELESGRLEHHVRVEDNAALADERDGLARRLREADDEASRLRKLLDAEQEQVCVCRVWLLALLLKACARGCRRLVAHRLFVWMGVGAISNRTALCLPVCDHLCWHQTRAARPQHNSLQSP